MDTTLLLFFALQSFHHWQQRLQGMITVCVTALVCTKNYLFNLARKLLNGLKSENTRIEFQDTCEYPKHSVLQRESKLLGFPHNCQV
jgi:hypothetical protein